MTIDEINIVDKFLQTINLEKLNTRIIKTAAKSFSVLIASINENKTIHTFEGKTISIVYGDYSQIMYQVVDELTEVIPYAANQL